MNIELKHEYSTTNPTECAIMAARGDHMEASLLNQSFEDVMEGTDKDKREFVETCIQRRHWGVFEHPQAFFVAEDVDVVTERQVTRHRFLSFDVQSMRYNDFSGESYVTPESFEDNVMVEDKMGDVTCESWYDEQLYHLFKDYDEYLDNGIPEEDARYTLPLATTVNMSFSGNLRALLHFCDVRHSGEAQWGAREFAEQIIEELRDWCPIVVEEWEEHAKNMNSP